MSAVEDLIKDIDKTVERANTMLRDGDRAPYFLKQSSTFFQGQLTPVEIVLNVPADGDFYGQCLHLAADARIYTAANRQQPPFLPCDWTYSNDIGAASYTVESDKIGSLSGKFELLLPEEYSNSPVNSSSLFSARHGYPIQTGRAPFSAWAGALNFKTLLFVKRATAITVRFTPTYAKVHPSEDGAEVNEYRITAIIPGHKKVKALR